MFGTLTKQRLKIALLAAAYILKSEYVGNLLPGGYCKVFRQREVKMRQKSGGIQRPSQRGRRDGREAFNLDKKRQLTTDEYG